MHFDKRTGENPAISDGWVCMLIVMVVNAALLTIEIIVRVTVAIVTWIVRGVRWLWGTFQGADESIWGEDELPRGATAPDP